LQRPPTPARVVVPPPEPARVVPSAVPTAAELIAKMQVLMDQLKTVVV
jgi:hypothetical protein